MDGVSGELHFRIAVRVTKVGPFTQMVVFYIRTGYGSPVDTSERGDPQGVPLLSICGASRWHEDVP